MREGEYKLAVAGVNFRKTALEIRSKFALTTENIKHIYESNHLKKPGDFFILSTCNRTEIYSLTNEPENLIGLLSLYNAVEGIEVSDYTFLKTGDEAMKHLFQVASGLDSQILGDYEIIGQLRNAFSLSKNHNCASGYMEKLVNAALQASRKVRNNTSISDGTTSVSYAVIQMLKQEIGTDAAMNVCLMGLGKIGTVTLKNLRTYLPQHRLTLVNRNEEKAQIAAQEFNVDFAKLEHQRDVMKNSDVLIVATGADHPIVTPQDLALSKVKLVFDLSVPSNVHPDVKKMSYLKFYDIDGLSQIVNSTLEQRKQQIPLALEIIQEHIAEFRDWEKRRELYSAKTAS